MTIPSEIIGANTTPSPPGSKTRLLNAALHVIRAKGYAAATIDDICREAALTKGSFFHHFKSKDDLALAAIAQWRSMTEGLFASAPYHHPDDPLDRLLGYLDFRDSILQGQLPEYTCLLGTLVQETYSTHPNIRAACEQALAFHVATLTRDLEAAKRLYAPDAPWTPDSVANFIQAVLQGSFIFAKAHLSPAVIRQNLDHLRRYLRILFNATGLAEPHDPERSETNLDSIAAGEEELDSTKTHFVD